MKTTTALGIAALAVLGAHAAGPVPSAKHLMHAERASSADLLAPERHSPGVRAAIRQAAPPVAMAGAPTADDVGDADSFERNVRWLGLRQMNINLSDACPPDPVEGFACQVLAPAGVTSFNFNDVARFHLPAKASRSIFCHWFSPYLSLAWSNTGATDALGTLTYSPTLTVENPVLDDPALINLQTGLPFGGSLTTSMSATERIVVPLAAGMAYDELRRDTATCIAGFVSRRALIENYGLNEAQATEFFKRPTTVRMNIRGTAVHVAGAELIFGLRIVGD